MKIGNRAQALWGVYAAFVGFAVYSYWYDDMFRLDVPLGGAKLLVWLALLGFLAYSFHCSRHEDLFRTVGTMSKLYWGRQIGIDLYLGLFVALFVVYLNEGAMVALVWLLPTLAFANLSILLYLALNFDTIVGKFLAG